MHGRLVSRLATAAATAAAVAVAIAAATTFTTPALAAAQARADTGAATIEPRAIQVLEAMDAALAGAQGLVATYRNETFRPNGEASGVETTTLRLGRPNVYRVETTRGGGPARIFASDGTTRFTVMDGPRSSCTTSGVAPLNDSREVETFNPIYWSFYGLGEWQIRSAMLGHWVTAWRLQDPGTRSVRYVGRETLGGAPVDVVEWTYRIGYNRPEDDPLYTSRLAIGADHLVRRIETTSTSKNEYEGRRIVETITDIRITPRPAAEDFRFEPPAGVACRRVNPEDPYTTGQFSDLPVGSKAPDFTLQTSRGERFHLAEFLAQHKVVLMNYWGYG